MANNEPEIFRQIADYIEKTYIDTLPSKERIERYLKVMTKGERRKLSLEIIEKIKDLVHTINTITSVYGSVDKEKEEKLDDLEYVLIQLNPSLEQIISHCLSSIKKLIENNRHLLSTMPPMQADSKPTNEASPKDSKIIFSNGASINLLNESYWLQRQSQQQQRKEINQRIELNKKEINSLLDLISDIITLRSNLPLNTIQELLDNAEIKGFLESYRDSTPTRGLSLDTIQTSLDIAKIKKILDSMPNSATLTHDSIHTALDEATMPIHKEPIFNPKEYKDLDPIHEYLHSFPTTNQHQEELDRILRQFEQSLNNSQTTDSSTKDNTPAPPKPKH